MLKHGDYSGGKTNPGAASWQFTRHIEVGWLEGTGAEADGVTVDELEAATDLLAVPRKHHSSAKKPAPITKTAMPIRAFFRRFLNMQMLF